MEDKQRQEFIKQTFNAVAPGYDRPALRFFHDNAAQLAEQLRLTGNEHVLDIATGTGAVALTLAQHLPAGHVTGIDFSEGMLQQAKDKAQALGLRNVAFQVMDMTALSLPPNRFDCATAAFALFFVEDMAACLRGVAERLKPGGRVLASTFSEQSFAPNSDLFLERIERYGVAIPPLGWKRLCTEALNHELFSAAGLEDTQVVRRDLSYHLPNPEAWWEILWYAGFRGLLNQLSDADRERFKQEHLAEIAGLATTEGIPLHVEILYATGKRPNDG